MVLRRVLSTQTLLNQHLITERFQIGLHNFGFSGKTEKSGNAGPEFLHTNNWLEPWNGPPLQLEPEVLWAATLSPTFHSLTLPACP